MRLKLSLPLLLAPPFVLLWSSTIATTCYNPGGIAVDSLYQPCNGSAPASMCCHLGLSDNGGDACGSLGSSQYGLCGVTGSQLWRESCTDPTWKSAECLKLCWQGTYEFGDSTITACDDGSYCCGQNNATCCDAGDGLYIVNNKVASSPSSSSSSSPSSLSSSSSTLPTVTSSQTSSSSLTQASPTTFTPPPATPQKAGLSTGAKAGIGVGVAAIILVASAILAFFIWKRRKASQGESGAAGTREGTGETKKITVPEVDGGWRGYEVDGGGATISRQGAAEMP